MRNTLRWGIVGLLLMLLVAVPALAQDVILTPFTDETFGISGVKPDGWTTLGPGALARAASATDLVRLLQQVAPVAQDTVLQSLVTSLGLGSAPESVGTRETDALTWTLYKVDIKAGTVTVAVDLALAENEGKTYVVLLQTTSEEYDALHESVFLPVLDALAPLTAEPIEDAPYTAEDVTFPNGDITLAGTLTLPEGDGPFPVIVLVTGSGPEDRDELIAPVAAIKPFRLIADAVTREGIAVLRYDDRGVGKSTGDFAAATTADFASDASAAIDYLLTRDDIDADQIGLLGHSEGGMVAAMLGASNPHLAFVISMAGVAVSGREISLFQNAHALDLAGVSDEVKASLIDANNQIYDLVAAGDIDGAVQFTHDLALKQLQALPEDKQKAIGDLEAAATQSAEQQRPTFASPWFKFWLIYNTADDWAKTTIPVLAIFGGLDTQVDAELNAPPLEVALKAAGNTDYSIVTLPTANHLMQDAVTGELDEYATLKQEFTPDFLPTIIDWLHEHVDVTA